MGSINAQLVAQKVSGAIRNKKKVILADIIKDSGYSLTTSDSPTLVTKTKSYQKAMAIELPALLDGLQKEITDVKIAMSNKDKSKEEYRTLVGSLDILTKNYQLLSGGATERQVFVLPSEVIEKNNINIENSQGQV